MSATEVSSACNRGRVECSQIGARTTAAHHRQHVNVELLALRDHVGDLLGGKLALDPSGKCCYLERVARCGNLFVEVSMGRTAGAGDKSDAKRHQWHRDLLVSVEQLFSREIAQQLISVGPEAAKGELGIDRGHVQLKLPTGHVHLNCCLDADLDTVIDAHRVTRARNDPVDDLAV